MNRRLKKYLKEQGATPVEPEVLANYRQEIDLVIPKIAESIKNREVRAAELRIGANRASRTKKNSKD